MGCVWLFHGLPVFYYIAHMDWYYIDSSAVGEDRRKGPWSSTQMLSFAQRGLVTPDTLVWHKDISAWEPWSSQAELAKIEVPPEPVQVASIPLAVGRNYAGFWIRGAALFIDSLILQAVYLLIYPLFGVFGITEEALLSGESLSRLLLLLLVQVSLSGFYHAWFVKKYAGTPGKILLGLSVVHADGSPMTWGTAIGRYFATWISSLTLGVGYLLAAFDGEKRALHDVMARTRVMRKD